MSQTVLSGLPAHIDGNCRVLVLGSMPGAASLQEQQYYAHPRNRFWPLMEALFAVPAQAPYPARMHALQQAGVGVWDVLAHCQRPGSLDAAIVRGSEVVNPLAQLLPALPQLRAVGCNGATAAQAFARWVRPALPASWPVPVHALPSTSPANAAWSTARLLQAWQVLAD